MGRNVRKKSTGEKKVKSPSASKTDGKESTSAQAAEVVVEQPLVIATGGKTVTETTGAVASGEIASPRCLVSKPLPLLLLLMGKGTQ